MESRAPRIEWPTAGLILACTAVWLASTWGAGREGLWPLLVVAAVCVTLHSSLQHEALHGHPTRNRLVNEALVFLAPGLAVPYRRFKVLHMQHHNDPNLTDPYEDPESNYLAKADWDRLPAPVQQLRAFNNTMIGRLLIGPAVASICFWLADLRELRAGEARVWIAWGLHAVALMLTLGWVMGVCHLGFWTYVAFAAYPGFSLLMVRTFLEHRAEDAVGKRTCIVEDSVGFWSLLFLNNNLHIVHHMYPAVPWYRLPGLYAKDKSRFVEANGDYRFPGYWAIMRGFAFRQKGPVPHPFLRREGP